MTAQLLLIGDLDDTFLGDRDALRRFSEYFPAVKERLAHVRAFDAMANALVMLLGVAEQPQCEAVEKQTSHPEQATWE